MGVPETYKPQKLVGTEIKTLLLLLIMRSYNTCKVTLVYTFIKHLTLQDLFIIDIITYKHMEV